MIYSYYPGCTLSTKGKALDLCGREAFAALGIELRELDEWQCCGAVYPQAEDEIATKLSAVRALDAAKTRGEKLVTLCSACHHVLKRVNNDMQTSDYIRTSGGKVIARKGATFYAVSVSVCDIIRTLLNGSDSVLCVSTMMHGEFGIEDVCLSIPTIVNGDGIKGTLLPELTEDEVEKLRHSADVLKDVIKQVDFTQA